MLIFVPSSLPINSLLRLPTDRHDEADEQERDARLQAMRSSHRFESFAQEREGALVRHFVGGHDYFYALSEILDGAKETIFLMGWWISPELYLRRPPAEHEAYRLDRLLLKKAQEGVKIFVLICASTILCELLTHSQVE